MSIQKIEYSFDNIASGISMSELLKVLSFKMLGLFKVYPMTEIKINKQVLNVMLQCSDIFSFLDGTLYIDYLGIDNISFIEENKICLISKLQFSEKIFEIEIVNFEFEYFRVFDILI